MHQWVVFGHTIDLGWLAVPLTIGWVVLGINALNLIDGMDGLASTVGITVSLVVAAITFGQGLVGEALLAVALAGALSGFLAYNRPPATIYLGDCGSMTLGLALAFLTMRASLVAPDAATANVSLLLILLFVPLLDTGLAILRRRLEGRSFMTADRSHVHHRLLDRGLGVWGVLLFLGGVSLGAGLLGWIAVSWGQSALAWAVLATLLLLAARFRLVAHEEVALTWRLLVRVAARLAGRPAADMPSRRPGRLAPPHAPSAGGRPARKPPVATHPDLIHADEAAEEAVPASRRSKTAA